MVRHAEVKKFWEAMAEHAFAQAIQPLGSPSQRGHDLQWAANGFNFTVWISGQFSTALGLRECKERSEMARNIHWTPVQEQTMLQGASLTKLCRH